MYNKLARYLPSFLTRSSEDIAETNHEDCNAESISNLNYTEEPMLELGSIALAILEGATGALTSHLLTKRQEPINVNLLINQAARELREKDTKLEASIAEIDASLRGLKILLKKFPEFDIGDDNTVVYRPTKASDLGNILYKIDEEISSLRKPASLIVVTDGYISRRHNIVRGGKGVPEILKGIDEEIESMKARGR